MSSTLQATWVFLGGGLGALARFGTTVVCAYFGWDRSFPVSTLLVNALGCFLVGVVATVLFTHVDQGTHRAWFALMVPGFLGGFTTFSAFAWQSRELWLRESYGMFALHVLGNLGLSLIAVVAGAAIAHALFRSGA